MSFVVSLFLNIKHNLGLLHNFVQTFEYYTCSYEPNVSRNET